MQNNNCASKGGNKCGKDGAACSTDQKDCKPKGKCLIGFLISAVVVFATIFGFEWAFHGHYMMDSYKATASLWRPMEEMQQYCWVSLVRNIGTALVFTCLYFMYRCASGACGCPIKAGLKLGGKVGLLLGLTNFGAYMYLPIPRDMAISWLVGGVIEGLLMGLAIGVVFLIKEKKCKKA